MTVYGSLKDYLYVASAWGNQNTQVIRYHVQYVIHVFSNFCRCRSCTCGYNNHRSVVLLLGHEEKRGGKKES
uniref:Uncharacterized protein n=1 Tax=Arundo donax TaxID=35708 RepID=A0A0A8ZV00_ARUDO